MPPILPLFNNHLFIQLLCKNYKLYKMAIHFELKEQVYLRKEFYRQMRFSRDHKVIEKSSRIVHNIKQYADKIYGNFIKSIKNNLSNQNLQQKNASIRYGQEKGQLVPNTPG